MKASSITRSIAIAAIASTVLFSTSFAQKKGGEKVQKGYVDKNANIAEITKNDVEKKDVWNFSVESYPNPYVDKLNFKFQTPRKGAGRLQLYTLEGQRMAFVVIKHVAARTSATLTYYIPSDQRVPLIYKFTIAGQTATGKMSPAGENLSVR